MSEELIERYVRYPDSLSADERQSVEACIQSDAFAREVAVYYRELYGSIDRAGSEPEPRTRRPRGGPASDQ